MLTYFFKSPTFKTHFSKNRLQKCLLSNSLQNIHFKSTSAHNIHSQSSLFFSSVSSCMSLIYILLALNYDCCINIKRTKKSTFPTEIKPTAEVKDSWCLILFRLQFIFFFLTPALDSAKKKTELSQRFLSFFPAAYMTLHECPSIITSHYAKISL